jgi:hypothetical protein
LVKLSADQPGMAISEDATAIANVTCFIASHSFDKRIVAGRWPGHDVLR